MSEEQREGWGNKTRGEEEGNEGGEETKYVQAG